MEKVIQNSVKESQQLAKEDFKEELINDYKIAVTSRECSLLGRREVLTGKAKFGILEMERTSPISLGEIF